MSTGCEFHGEALADLAAGRLESAREPAVREHLSTCADCREDLEALRTVARAAAVPPAGLEARIRAAVRAAAGEAGEAEGVGSPRDAAAGALSIAPSGGGGRRRLAWRPWALPLAAAAGVAAIWLGLLDGGPGPDPDPGPEVEAILAADYAPYGAWPAGGAEVAGEPVLTELSADDLELLLEEMQP